MLKAVSSSIRMQVLNLLLDRGPLSYTEIMNVLKLNPSRDAGRFAYHLKFLLKTDLIESEAETRKYRLTELGRMLVDVAETIEERSFKRRRMMVRSSRLAMEEFDRNKIVESLVTEANVPHELAQKIARETEARLVEIKAKYLTAPLIRELVNAILVEKGLEEYRHKLTRLGLPIYDVTQLIKSAGAKSLSVEAVHKAAGDRVVEEYTLLNVLPRDIADAHLSGSLHLSNLGTWILKPNEFTHDLRFFLKNGVHINRPDLAAMMSNPPKTLEAALQTTANMLRLAATEVAGEQLIDYLNVFLAPFAKGVETERIKESLRLFCLNLNQSVSNEGMPLQVSVGLELAVPKFLSKENATGSAGVKAGVYGDYVEESRQLANVLLEFLHEEIRSKPFLQPSVIVKIRPETLRNKDCASLLNSAHKLACERGLPYFANLSSQEQIYACYTATGSHFSCDWKQDWELDTLGTSSLDTVLINLPRIAYESEGSTSKLYQLLDVQLEMALRALEIKHQTLKQRTRENLLPVLAQKAEGDTYTRMENSTRLISFIGLNEAAEALTGKSLHEDPKALSLAQEIMKHTRVNIDKAQKKPETRPRLAMAPGVEAARRLAALDVERYGWGQVHVKGTREQPFYTDLAAVPAEAKLSLDERVRIEEQFQQQASGGHLAVLQLGDEPNADELLSTTKKLGSSKIGFFAYSHVLTFCSRCGKTSLGRHSKCPVCGATSRLTYFRRESAKYTVV